MKKIVKKGKKVEKGGKRERLNKRKKKKVEKNEKILNIRTKLPELGVRGDLIWAMPESKHSFLCEVVYTFYICM